MAKELVKNKNIESSINYADSLMIAIGELEAKALSECMNFLKGLLSLNGGKIEFHEYDVDGIQTDDNCFYVKYNGGAHPEYASNCFSDVKSVVIYGEKIYLNIEDCEEYPIEELDDREVIDMCLYIYSNLMD
jgi:hypothetical protein